MTRFLNPAQRELVRDWWYALQPRGEKDPLPRGIFAMFSRADRAEMRRCQEPAQVLLQGAFIRLHAAFNELQNGSSWIIKDATALALVAGLLAWVKNDLKDGSSFARQLGETGEADRPLMSKLRFSRLQTATTEEEFYQLARRAIQLVDGKADVAELAEELLAWVSEFRGKQPDKPKDRIQVRWATAYYQVALKLKEATDLPTTRTGA